MIVVKVLKRATFKEVINSFKWMTSEAVAIEINETTKVLRSPDNFILFEILTHTPVWLTGLGLNDCN